jgi:cyclopropane-fatty-acyl-phospholipid synthase
LGPRRKYSCCLYQNTGDTLAMAEDHALADTARHADLADGQEILELGCGWGSLTLWMAQHFPNARITAVSNSHGQRGYIEAEAAKRGFTNLKIITADMNDFVPTGSFDRVVSVEMFEHLRNYGELLRRIAGWLTVDGQLFVHVFAHRRYAYPFEDRGASDWMAREFFTGGLMPSVGLLHEFQDDLQIVQDWQIDGTHYARTAECWHANLMAHRADAAIILGDRAKVERWRVFFLACAELFDYRGGTEWLIAHYLFRHRG